MMRSMADRYAKSMSIYAETGGRKFKSWQKPSSKSELMFLGENLFIGVGSVQTGEDWA
jgi:hypothetical protein